MIIDFDFRSKAFIKYVEPYLGDFVIISDFEVTKIKNWVSELLKNKNINFYGCDIKFLDRRFTYGKTCETAVENHIKHMFVEWDIKKNFEPDRTDFANLGVKGGIKSSQYNYFPLVPVNPTYPEVICIRNSWKNSHKIFICGYATIPMLKYYQSSLLADDNVKGKKAGYWGFKPLHKFETKDDLLKLFNDKDLNSFSNFTDKLDISDVQLKTFDYTDFNIASKVESSVEASW